MHPALAALDRALLKTGQDVVLQRMQIIAGTQSVAAAVTVRAQVRGYEPNELIGGITQNDSKLIISPTAIISAAWVSGAAGSKDQRVPIKGNRVVISGRVRAVEAAAGLYLDGELVRIEARVTG